MIEPGRSNGTAQATAPISKVTKLPSAKPPKRRKPRALPDDLLWRSSEEAARRLALKSLGAARTAERRLDDRFDREALHDFRVAVRRLRSVLRAYKVELAEVVSPKDRKRLRTIQRATGAGREAEVALKWLKKQHGTLAPEHVAGLNWLSAILLERRRRCSNDLDAQLRASFRTLIDQMEERLAIMRSEQNLLTENTVASFARCAGDLTDAHADELQRVLGHIANLDDTERLHEGRICGKRLRYLLEPLRPYVNEAQPIVKRTKQLQDVLGDLNDVHVLMSEIDTAIQRSMSERADRIRRALAGRDFERARREAVMIEWSGLLELHLRLETERTELIATLRDNWLSGGLDLLVSKARGLARHLRHLDQPN
ncbi:MAG: CHAD domain-containing protein [Myxococcota bacterium]